MLGARAPAFRGAAMAKQIRDARMAHKIGFSGDKPPRSYFVKGMTDKHEIPALDFSRTDLTTKLNRALGIRNSKSQDELQGFRSSHTSQIDATRPGSADFLSRADERYRSYFSMEIHDDELEPSSDDPEEAGPTLIEILESKQKALGAETELLTEINRLSIPSVNNLTARLSELIPSMTARLAEKAREKSIEGRVNDLGPSEQGNSHGGQASRLGSIETSRSKDSKNVANSAKPLVRKPLGNSTSLSTTR